MTPLALTLTVLVVIAPIALFAGGVAYLDRVLREMQGRED